MQITVRNKDFKRWREQRNQLKAHTLDPGTGRPGWKVCETEDKARV